jgi:hypothetical protein
MKTKEGTKPEAIIAEALARYREEGEIIGAIQELFEEQIGIMAIMAEAVQERYLNMEDLDDLFEMLAKTATMIAYNRCAADHEDEEEGTGQPAAKE